jgi:hypothetical protein
MNVQGDLQNDLAQARQDPAIRDEAEALERMLLVVRQEIEDYLSPRAGEPGVDAEEEPSEPAPTPAASPPERPSKVKRRR